MNLIQILESTEGQICEDHPGNSVCVCVRVCVSVCPPWRSWLPPAAVAVLHQRSWGWRGSSWTNWTGICTPPQHWTSCTLYVSHTHTQTHTRDRKVFLMSMPLSISLLVGQILYWNMSTSKMKENSLRVLLGFLSPGKYRLSLSAITGELYMKWSFYRHAVIFMKWSQALNSPPSRLYYWWSNVDAQVWRQKKKTWRHRYRNRWAAFSALHS